MERRTFLKAGLAAGVLTGVLPGCSREADTNASPGTRSHGSELDEMTIAAMQDGLASGQFTSRGLVEHYLDRIERIDRSGPEVNSVIEINPDAIAIAGRLDEERMAQGPRGPMHGIPILIKDNIDTADAMSTSAGSLALAASIAERDAFVVQRLRASGAVLLGKTNLSEWANFRSSRSSSGWSGRGGQTKNPYVLDRNPCGSSSGSGAAVAANLCAAAVGTETDGSVVCPSSANGVVGIKPTLGLVSRTGIIPIAHSQDTAGPMGRTVADAAALLSAMAGPDPADAVTQEHAGRHQADYTRFLNADALSGARIGIARSYMGFDDRVDALMEGAFEVMRTAGAILVEDADIKTRREWGDAEYEVLLYEFKADLNRYLAGLPPSIPHRTLDDLIAFNEANREREMPFFGQEIFLAAVEKGPLTDSAYLEARARCIRLSREEGIDATLAEHNVVALLAPTGGPAWTTDLVNGDHFSGGSSSAAAVSGYANITVPMGDIHGLPVGLSFIGGAFAEPTLIGLAYAFEQRSKARITPQFTPTLT